MSTVANEITIGRLKALFDYDLVGGKLYWKNVSKFHIALNGKEAGFARRDSNKPDKYYWIVKINRYPYKRAHIIYALANSKWAKMLDHKDGNSLNDSISNLRPASTEQNNWNRKATNPGKLLPMGVRLVGGSGRYQARIAFRSKHITLGTYDTIAEAKSIYLAKRQELYGEFA